MVKRFLPLLFVVVLAAPAALAAESAAQLPAEGPNGKPLAVQEKVIALTFDDGPLPGVTPQVLDALASAGFRATFCVLGERVAADPALAKTYTDAGHEIVTHSWNHPHFTKITDEEARDQLRRTHDAIIAATGKVPVFFRPPYFSMDPAKSAIVREFGYTILYDSLNGKDWVRPAPTPEETIRQVVDNIRPGDIVLLHESFPNTVKALPALVKELAALGFRSETVSTLQSLAAEPK
jgi:endo-1,4-beta-xylanase